MATRRPSVPKATFTTGIGTAEDKSGAASDGAAKSPAAESTTPGPGKADPAGSAKGTSGRGKTSDKQRRPASAAQGREDHHGVIHPAESGPVPARKFSGRLLVLGLAMAVVTVLLAPNVHTFLQQRSEISALQQEISREQEQQAGLQTELSRWDDPAYIKQQARDRVSMLMPGETGYWVYGANGVDVVPGATAATKSLSVKNATEVSDEPWVESLWGAVQDSAKVQAAPTPAPAPGSTPPAEPAPTP